VGGGGGYGEGGAGGGEEVLKCFASGVGVFGEGENFGVVCVEVPGY